MAIEKNTKNTLKHEEPQYTTLLNEVLNNIKHTGALGVYCFLASKSSGWDICKKHLQNHFECGREHIDTCFKYLKKIGAIQVSMIRDEKGRFIGWETVLKRRLPAPVLDDIQITENPLYGDNSEIRVIQNTGFPDSGKSAPRNNRYIKIKDIKNTIVDFEKSTDVDYAKNDIVNLGPKEKSDYQSNHGQGETEGNLDLGTEINQTKSDYFEKQSTNKTTRKNSAQKKHESYKNDELFMFFYSIYPNKQKPEVARKAFYKHKPDKEFVSMLCADVQARVENNWKNRHKSKIPHPSTYLNSREWEGEIVPPDNNIRKFTKVAQYDDNDTSWIREGGL